MAAFIAVLHWIIGGACILASWTCGEVAGEAIYRPAKYRFGTTPWRLACLAFAVIAALCWRAA